MQKRAVPARKCLAAVVHKMVRRYGRNKLPLFAVLFHKINCFGRAHVLKRDFQFWIFIEQTREHIRDKHFLAVIGVFFFAICVKVHLAVEKKRHSDIFHLSQNFCGFKNISITPVRICRSAIRVRLDRVYFTSAGWRIALRAFLDIFRRQLFSQIKSHQRFEFLFREHSNILQNVGMFRWR